MGRRAGTFGAWLWIAALAGCAHQMPLQPVISEKGGAAEGRVTLVERSHGVRVVEVIASDLPRPNNDHARSRAYVVWIVTKSYGIENLGALQLAGTEGHLEAVVPKERFQLFITAERSPDVPTPSPREKLLEAGVHW